jgi:uncharacterized metal-binding protein YceD (DUF177 family)
VKGLREFEIPFIGLKVGIHNFNYDIDDSFFKHFADSLIQQCKVSVRVEFEKKETFFVLKFFIDGQVNVDCDRCLYAFSKNIFGDFTMFIKFAEDPTALSDEDEVMYIAREETIIDISQLVYEYINLCLPIQILGCASPGEEPQCNQEVLKRLTPESSIKKEETDPRWAALKDIKDKN